MNAPPRISHIWRDTLRPGFCREPSCRARIVFAQNVKTGNVMPFDAPLRHFAEIGELGTDRVMLTVDLNTSHFVSCPARAKFRRAR